jgi:hypothetical protein
MKFTKRDVAYARGIYLQLRDDEFGEFAETAMFSFGYADVRNCGDVIYFGMVVFVLTWDGELEDGFEVDLIEEPPTAPQDPDSDVWEHLDGCDWSNDSAGEKEHEGA